MPSRIDQLAFILVTLLVFSGTCVLARPGPTGKRVTFAEPPARASPKASGANMALPPPSPQGYVLSLISAYDTIN